MQMDTVNVSCAVYIRCSKAAYFFFYFFFEKQAGSRFKSCYSFMFMYTVVQKVGVSKIFSLFFEEDKSFSNDT